MMHGLTPYHTCTAPTPAAMSVEDDIALDKPPETAPAAAAVLPSLLLPLLLAARAAARAAASRPAAAATELVVTDSRGTLNSLVVVLNTDSATPTPASCVAPAGNHAHET